jgi:hypothetical protein
MVSTEGSVEPVTLSDQALEPRLQAETFRNQKYTVVAPKYVGAVTVTGSVFDTATAPLLVLPEEEAVATPGAAGVLYVIGAT